MRIRRSFSAGFLGHLSHKSRSFRAGFSGAGEGLRIAKFIPDVIVHIPLFRRRRNLCLFDLRDNCSARLALFFHLTITRYETKYIHLPSMASLDFRHRVMKLVFLGNKPNYLGKYIISEIGSAHIDWVLVCGEDLESS